LEVLEHKIVKKYEKKLSKYEKYLTQALDTFKEKQVSDSNVEFFTTNVTLIRPSKFQLFLQGSLDEARREIIVLQVLQRIKLIYAMHCSLKFT
jgi:hypothetical protein